MAGAHALRAGAPFEIIARQLGHRDVAMVAKVYGRFKPDTEERDRWERIAAGRDQEKWSGRVATDVVRTAAAPENLHEESPVTPDESEALDSSQGGTVGASRCRKDVDAMHKRVNARAICGHT
jgi:hypothetical protein